MTEMSSSPVLFHIMVKLSEDSVDAVDSVVAQTSVLRHVMA